MGVSGWRERSHRGWREGRLVGRLGSCAPPEGWRSTPSRFGVVDTAGGSSVQNGKAVDKSRMQVAEGWFRWLILTKVTYVPRDSRIDINVSRSSG